MSKPPHVLLAEPQVLESLEKVIGHLVALKRSGKSASSDLQPLIHRLAEGHARLANALIA